MRHAWAWFVGVLLALSLPPLTAPAHAHGGIFVPPPPSTPGRATPVNTPRANTPTHVNPGTGGPVVTPGGGFLRPGMVGRRAPTFTPTYEVSWRLWWDLHRSELLPQRPSTLAAAVVTPAPAPGVDPYAEWEAKRGALAKDVVVPFLLKVVDPAAREDPDVVASACLALGKLATDPKVAPVLLERLLDENAKEIVRESAALALGLLRRSKASQAFAARELEPVREKLLKSWDQQVDGKRVDVPLRARVFALFALGLLGDQEFLAHPQTKEGRLLSQLVWQRYTKGPYRRTEEWVAVLTAVGLQPPEGMPDAVRRGIEKTAEGEKVGNHKVSPTQVAHAIAAWTRLAGPRALPLLLKRLGQPRRPKEHPGPRLAAVIALGDLAPRLKATERLIAARVVERALESDQELLVMGLLNVTLGRLVRADLADGATRLLASTRATEILFARASTGPYYVRGFGVLALALAARQGPGDEEAVQRFRQRAADLVLTTFRERTLEPDLRAAAAVGLGLMRVRPAVRDLVPAVRKATADPDLRSAAALALGMVGIRSPEAVQALEGAVVDDDAPEGLRAHAAVGLSLLGSPETAERLIEGLAQARRTSHLAGIALALGHLGELSAVEPLVAAARREGAPELVRAMAVVALGRLLDPEHRPSLYRLQIGAPYPLRTPSMEEAFTIL